MKTYYIRNNWVEPKIYEKEIVKETDKMIFYENWRGNLDREAKVSEYHWHHKNFEDAHQALLYKAQNQVDNLKSRLASALANLEIIKSMTKESIEKEL